MLITLFNDIIIRKFRGRGEQDLLGTIVNVVAIILGALLGNLLKGGFPEKYKSVIMQGVSLTVILIGLSMALKTESILVVTLSIVTGGILGEALRLEDRLDSLGRKLEQRFAGGGESSQGSIAEDSGNVEGGLESGSPLQAVGRKCGSNAETGLGGANDASQNAESGLVENENSSGKGSLFIKGFVTASLVFCVGAMAIMGALESGLTGRHTTLFIKSILDGVTATVFASTMGIGVTFSALPVFIYQGAITLAAAYVKPFLTDAMITEMTAVGGLLIFGIGLNLLTDKLHIKVGNLLPAIFVATFFVIILGKFSL